MKKFNKLSSIAQIFTGTYLTPANFRGGVKDAYYLQLKNFLAGSINAVTLYPELDSERVQKFILRDNDILVAAKGSNNFAWKYSINIGNAVASTSFFVVRLTSHIIDADFLTWYLNHPIIIDRLKGLAIGTSMPSITKNVLEDLLIPVPGLQNQANIVKLQSLINKEIQLTQQILEYKTNYYNQLLFNTLAEDYPI